ncbi:MAG: NAD-dependent epimerase/dehydratase family protein [Chitinophagia bacterium]|jgi:UDP-2-acetamido-2,6-beta-L-arabino-hexul-4-ose reductase
MITIGITGSKGFIGTHLFNTLSLHPIEYQLIEINRADWSDKKTLTKLVNQCDVIFHLSGVNRNENSDYIYSENIRLASLLLDILYESKHPIKVIFSSSLQENNDSVYGKAKLETRKMFEKWALQTQNIFFGLVIPNVFGPFGKPFYNSFISTFCFQINNGEEPVVISDSVVPLIYVGDLVAEMIGLIDNDSSNFSLAVKPGIEIKVTDVLAKLNGYRSAYLQFGKIPQFDDKFDIQLFNTFRSYIDYANYFPREYILHADNRGSFVELVKLESGGQISFSTTNPGMTRGNHFHTRKIERFCVIKGKAKVEIQRLRHQEVLTFYMNGESPSYIDIPIWYMHNITNVGEEILYTIFWISEQYDPLDADTFIHPK